MEVNILIRKPSIADIPELASLHLRAWKIAYRDMVPEPVLDDLRLEAFETRWMTRLKNPNSDEYIALVEQAGSIQGFATLGTSREAMDLPSTYGEIYTIYVNPDCWRQGAGRALMQHAFSYFEAHGFPGCFLWTLKTNTRARTFYEKMGMNLAAQERYISTHGVELLCCCYFKKSPL